jgi:hypothetical protein
MGIVVEYANRTGAPEWKPAAPTGWNLTAFGAAGDRQTAAPSATNFPIVRKISK